MTNVESQAGAGHEAHRPGYIAAILAFGVLVLIGAWSLSYMRGQRTPLIENSSETSDAAFEALAVMGEQRFVSRAEDFRSADAVGVMGHCVLDLRQAAMTGDHAEIDAVAVMGHVEILVPPDWIVVPDDVVTVGSFVNRARHSDAENPRTVKLTGAVFLGELQVRR